MTVLLLSITVIAIVAPMHAEGQTSAASDDFYLKAGPPAHTIHRLNGESGSATYSVNVTALSEFRGEVGLSMTGLPATCIAFFNPEKAIPNPVFSSVLEIVVPPTTPPGTYALKISGASGRTTHYATTTLIVEGEPSPSSVTATQTTSAKTTPELKISVTADRESYSPGQDVEISGYVKLSSGASAARASVSLSVLEPDGDEVHAAVLQTNDDGRFAEDFTLPSTAANGTYTVYATANMSGYKKALATDTFTVGLSNVPSVHIVEAIVTMPNGTLSSEFRPGETVVVWAWVNSAISGADLVGGNTWVEVFDPDNSPIALVIVKVTIHTGEPMGVGVYAPLASGAKTGIYTVRILVSDRPIVAGGKFLSNEETAFLVTKENGATTTTT
jgi:5-hydroxyisourate hydrolase-like protein (transthyretin family)